MLGVDQRSQFRQHHLGDCRQIALALQQTVEFRQIALEPILLRVLPRGFPQVADHLVDVVLELRHFTLCFHLHVTRQIALGHGSRHIGDCAHLIGQVGRQTVHVVGQIAPGAGSTRHVGLAPQLALDAHFTRHRGHLIGEQRQRIGHTVDGVGQFGDLTLGFQCQFLLHVAVGYRGHHFRDASHLAGQVGGHEVHVFGQIPPGAGHALHLCLSPELSFGADFARHPRHFGGKAIELVHHGVDGVLQLHDFALGFHGNLAPQVAFGHRRRHVGDVAHLIGQVGRHAVDRVGQIFPGSTDACHLGLATELAVSPHFASHARHFVGKGRELVHHRVDGFLELENFSFRFGCDLA
ncbi:hypothetical protein D3C76_521070 [compost metagenome]